MSRLVIAALGLLAAGDGLLAQEPEARPRLAFVGASWCPPCKVQSRDVVPELRQRGYEVLEYDIDAAHVRRVFPTASVPAWFVISGPFHAASADEVCQTATRRRPCSAGVTPPSAEDRPPPPPDLVALFRDHLGERASLELSLTSERSIAINATTRLRLPKVVQCDVDGREPRSLVITFGAPVPTAQTQKLGATISADIPEVRITGHTITATADVGLGLKKRLVFELKELPWD